MSLSKLFGFGAAKWPGLAKVAEECGELLQVIGKLMATDGDKLEHWDGTNLRQRLIEEAADVAAAVRFVYENVLSKNERQIFKDRHDKKIKRFMQWHQEGLNA